MWDHSDFRDDLSGRLKRTAQFVSVVSFGAKKEAERLLRKIAFIHQSVVGVTEQGKPYQANDTELLLWVHATQCFGYLQAHQRYHSHALTEKKIAQYLKEYQQVLSALGGEEVQWKSWADLIAYLESKTYLLEGGHRVEEVYSSINSREVMRRVMKGIAVGRALGCNEVKGLFDSCLHDENTLAGCRDAAILALLVGCGFRRSEIVGINIGHYDRHQKLVKVLGKGNKERENAIPGQLVPFVDNWFEQRACKDSKSPLFVRFFKGQKQSSQRMTAQAVYYLLEKRSAAQHMQTFTPHDLRRTFATSLFDQGESIRTVQLALGHQNIETTKIYDKRGEQRKNEVLRNLSVF